MAVNLVKRSESLPEIPQGVELTERESKAYAYWCASKEPPLCPSTQAQLFQLFLQSKTCEQIRSINPGFSLGSIVQARLSGHWDEEVQLHLKELLGKVRQRIQQTTLETVDLFCDLLTAKNKLYKDRVLKFIQTGNEKELGDLRLEGLKGYKEVIEALLKVTGQDQNKKVSGNLTVTVEPPQAAAPVTSETAAAILSALKTVKDEKKGE